MDTEEKDTARTPKNKKIEKAGQLVHVAKGKGKKKQMKVKGQAFEIQEYTFDKILEGATYRYKSKTELLEKYKYVWEKNSNETLKLCDQVRKLSSQDVSLVSIRD